MDTGFVLPCIVNGMCCFFYGFIAWAGNVLFEPDVGCVVFALVLHVFLKYACVVVVFVVEGAFVVCLFFSRKSDGAQGSLLVG